MLHLPTVKENLGLYIDAGFPILYICTYEEANADKCIAAAAGNMEVLEWNGANCGVNFKTKAPDDFNRSLEATLLILKRGKELNRKLLVIKDAADQLKSPKVIALLKEIARKIRKLVSETEGYSGADIEGVVNESVESAFVKECGSLTTGELLECIHNTNPLSVIMKKEIEDMTKRYKEKMLKAASR